ncbi:MFS transporter [Frateuria aurantia]
MTGESAAAGQPARRPAAGRVVAATVIGNLLEFFDFTVFSYFALSLGRAFFPADDPRVSTLLALATFAIGFVVRPLGGLVLGRYADRHGRRPVMCFSLLLMGVASLLIALAPTYRQVGLLAPLWMIAARLLQGFAQGGEFGPATATLIEAGDPARRAWRASWQLTTQSASGLLGSGLAALLAGWLPASQLDAWGWRIPFVLGTLVVPVGLYLRKILLDPPAPARPKPDWTRGDLAVWWRVVLAHMGVTVAVYVLMFYAPTFAIQYLGLPTRDAMLATAASTLWAMLLSPWVGAWSDRLRKRKPLIVAGRLLLVGLVYPIFALMLHRRDPWVFGGGLLALVTVYTLGAAPTYALMPESFRRPIRAGGLSSAYAISVAVFGGTAQLVAAGLIRISGNELAPAWYMIGSGLVSVWAVASLRETGAVAD